MLDSMRWIITILGFIIGNLPGAIIAYIVSGFFLKKSVNVETQFKRRNAQDAYFTALAGFVSAVIKADGQIDKTEIIYIKNSFVSLFGVERARLLMAQVKRFNEIKIPLQEIAEPVRRLFPYDDRLMILYLLQEIAKSDGEFHPKEKAVIVEIALLLDLSLEDQQESSHIGKADLESAYRLLGVSPTASDEEVKSAYKKLAVKYHPDKVAHLGKAVQNEANDRFAKINSAYDLIKTVRSSK